MARLLHGVVYFLALFGLAIAALCNLSGAQSQSLVDWFALVISIRVADLHYTFYTLLSRRFDPRRRRYHFYFSVLSRMISAIAGLIATVLGSMYLTENGTPDSLVVAVAFYSNFVPLVTFYFALTPFGCCCFASWFFLSPSEPTEAAVHNRQRRNNVDNFVHEEAFVLPNNSHVRQNNRKKHIQEETWSFFKQLFATDDVTECALCCAEYTDVDVLGKLPCGHYFHQTCIQTVLRDNRCPYCRQEISAETKDYHQAQ